MAEPPRRSATGQVVREATVEDLDEILRIENEAFTDPWSPHTFRGMMRRDDAAVLVMAEGDALVGYAVFWWVGEEAELGNIATAPERRGEGSGQRLLATVLDRMSRLGATCCYLEVREGNEVARRLYDSAGFVTVGRRRRYYRYPLEDALVLRRDLSHGRDTLEETASGGSS